MYIFYLALHQDWQHVIRSWENTLKLMVGGAQILPNENHGTHNISKTKQ